MNEMNEKQLAYEYEKKLKGLFKQEKIKTKSKSKSKNIKLKYNLLGGKKSRKNRTRKERK